MTLGLLHLASLVAGVLAYFALTIFCIVTWARRITGRAAFIASLTTLAFLVSRLLGGFNALSFTLEAAAVLAWMVLLARIIGLGPRSIHDERLRGVALLLGGAVVLALAAVGYAWTLAALVAAGAAPALSWLFAAQVLIAVSGLVLLEQVVRNLRDDYRWRLRYLNIGIGTLLVFQLIHNACALLLSAYLPALLIVQPAVFALAAPFVAVASLRNPSNPLQLNLSRQFVFRSGVLVASGAFLLLMGVAGYFAQLLGGDWGAAIGALLITVLVLTAITVAGSTEVRTRAGRWVAEHLFSYRYDYREEWQRVTRQLTEPSADFDLGQQVIRALCGVLHSSGGAVWRRSDQGLLIPVSELHTGWHRSLSPATSRALIEFFAERAWVIDLEALPKQALAAFAQATDLTALPHVRFVVPLMTHAGVFGVAALTRPPIPTTLGWEDYDVLKLIGRECAGFIALQEAERELADAEKLNSFNQISAFVVHDVKTISAQLSLLVANAERHASNPVFVADMVATVGNAVARMDKLLAQLRESRQQPRESVGLRELIRETVASYRGQQPAPEFTDDGSDARVRADRTQLRSALGHLIQNAIDATAQGGRVAVRLGTHGAWAEIHIEDDGPGMEADFVTNVLFAPFTSTKGVAGMGVGAYQARTYVRGLGGDIGVASRPGEGTRFTVQLPLQDGNEKKYDDKKSSHH